MQIHCLGMRLCEGADLVDGADDLIFIARCIDDGIGIVIDITQADLGSRVTAAGPVPFAVERSYLTALLEDVEHGRRIFAEERFVFYADRQLAGGTTQMPEDDIRIGWIDDRIFRRFTKEIFRVLHQILINRRVVRNKDSQALLRSPARPARLLPRTGNRTRIADHQAGRQRTDINPEFQGTGARDT